MAILTISSYNLFAPAQVSGMSGVKSYEKGSSQGKNKQNRQRNHGNGPVVPETHHTDTLGTKIDISV